MLLFFIEPAICYCRP